MRLVETAADKFVGLGRRAGFAFADLGPLDHTLVRHVYDLSRMDGHYDADEAAAIALETMKAEAKSRADDYPAYKADPRAETLRAYETSPNTKNSRRVMRSCSATWSMVKSPGLKPRSERFNISSNG